MGKIKFIIFIISLSIGIFILLIIKNKYSEIKEFIKFLTKIINNVKKENKRNINEDIIKTYLNEESLKKYINNEIIENDIQLNKTKILIKNSKNKELISNWEIFKQKVFIKLFSSLCLIKYFSLISLTNISLINIFQLKNNYSNSISQIILNELWNIINQSQNDIYGTIKDIILHNISNISLQTKYNYCEFKNLFKKILKDILTINYNYGEYKCFHFYTNNIETIINNYENINYFECENNQRIIIEYKIKYYKLYYDIITSELFINLLYVEIERIINICLSEIENKVNKEKISLAKYILFMDEYNYLDNKEYKNNTLLINYYNILSNII